MGGKSSQERARIRDFREKLFRRRLLRWFRRHGRDLPWRRTRDPYQVLVSEFMLQQTQVSRVREYYPRFLEAFPSLHTLAAAHPRQVREQWDGLGYYRRARNLHLLARRVVDHHDGSIPSDLVRLRSLPGIGPYTAGAVLSFAFEKPVAAVDTNVARVIRRAFYPRLPQGKASRRIWETTQRLVPRNGKRAWTFNQAVMELGALICTARAARCSLCPVQAACSTGGRSGRPAVTPSGTAPR
jgi:A/G-specific adenine glycosylase